MNVAHALFDGLRAQAPALLGATDDPHAELLALVWGPRFDREHAQDLLAGGGLASSAGQTLPAGLALKASQVVQAIRAAADSFDRLPAPRQQRLRQLIVQHRGAVTAVTAVSVTAAAAPAAARARPPVGQFAPCPASC